MPSSPDTARATILRGGGAACQALTVGIIWPLRQAWEADAPPRDRAFLSGQFKLRDLERAAVGRP
jgi:hypothetical protein